MSSTEPLNRCCDRLKPDTEAIFISSRIRLARNVAGELFSPAITEAGRRGVFEACRQALLKTRKFAAGVFLNLDEMSADDREMLVERNMISRELAEGAGTRGAFVSADCSACVMVNEEDHLRIQMLARGLCLESLWKKIDSLDNQIEKSLAYAFSPEYGYLTACPTNAGTGMRASVMMHLAGLSMTGDAEKVVRGLNQLGMVARGSNGEGSDPQGAFYQISNQQTLGVSELEIVSRITEMCVKIAGFERNAREVLLEKNPELLFDKIARARAVIDSCRIISSTEAVECLSAMRLAADMGFMPAKSKIVIDAMLLDVRPAHLKRDFGSPEMSAEARDILRARVLKGAFKGVRRPSFPRGKKNVK